MTPIEQILQNQSIILQWIADYNTNKKKISDLTSSTDIDGNTLVPVSIGGQTYRAPLSLVATYVKSLSQFKENVYADIPEMLGDQANQTEGLIQFVEDAGDDPEVTVGQYAYYDFKGTLNANLGVDYRKLSDEEVQVIDEITIFNEFTVSRVHATSINDIVGAGGLEIKYDSGTDKIQYIHFDPVFSSHLAAFSALSGSLSYVLVLNNVTQNKSLIAKVSAFAYTDGSNTCYKLTVENSMSRLVISETDKVQVELSAFTSGLSNPLTDLNSTAGIDIDIDSDDNSNSQIFRITHNGKILTLFELREDGTALLPTSSLSDIVAGGDRSIITLEYLMSNPPLEEKVVGSTVEDSTLGVDRDISMTDEVHKRFTLTGNVIGTIVDTPTEGFSSTTSMVINSDTTESFAISNATHVYGEYDATGVDNLITIISANTTVHGLEIHVIYNQPTV